MKANLTQNSITFSGKKKDVLKILARLNSAYGDMKLSDYLKMANNEMKA